MSSSCHSSTFQKHEEAELHKSRSVQPEVSLPSNSFSTSPRTNIFHEFDRSASTGKPGLEGLDRAPHRLHEIVTQSNPEVKPTRRTLAQPNKTVRKPSQRPALSCTECARQCDKTVPCTPCSKRGRQSICRQELWIPSSSAHAGEHTQASDYDRVLNTLNDLKFEVNYLREQVQDLDNVRDRLRELEEIICHIHCDRQRLDKDGDVRFLSPSLGISDGLSTSPTAGSQFNGANHTASPTTSTISERRRNALVDKHDTSEDAATTFEYLALGGNRQGSEAGDPMHGSKSTSFTSVRSSSANLSAALTTENHQRDSLLGPLPPNALAKLKSSGESLTKDQSDAIIDFALDTLGWQHPVIHFTTFRGQVSTYWRNIQESNKVSRNERKDVVLIVNQAWFALYIALLSVGTHHMSPRFAEKCNLTEEDLKTMPRLWFSDCIAALYRFNFLANPSIEALQTITVLGCSGYEIAPPNILCALHACANSIAQTLAIHCISPDPPTLKYDDQVQEIEPSESSPKWSAIELMEREIAKRVWWALVTADWLAVPHHKSWCISPGHFTTPIPRNWPDKDFPEMNFSGPPMQNNHISMVMQQIILSQVAEVIQRFFSRLMSKPNELHEDTVFQADSDIQRIVSELPPILKEIPNHISPEEKAKLPPYVNRLRHFLKISCAHKRLVIHRSFLNHITSLAICKSKSGQVTLGKMSKGNSSLSSDPPNRPTDPKLSFGRFPGSASNLNRKSAIESKAICIKLSREITREIVECTSQFEERPTWNTPYIAVGAMTLLSLDLLELSMHSSSSKMRNKRTAEYEIDVSTTNSINRAKKHLKRCPNQNGIRNFEGSSEINPVVNDQEDNGTWAEMSTTLETLTDEEIQATKEVRRRELEQGLEVLERLSRWSPIAERGVILVRNLLGQKDPLNTVIDPEKTPSLQRTCNRPGIFATTAKSLTAPITKIVARQDLKSTGQIDLFPPQVKECIDLRLVNANEGNRRVSPNNLPPLAHVPPILPPHVNAGESFHFNQVTPSDVFQSTNAQQYHLGTSYQQLPTQDLRAINHTNPSNATFHIPPNDEQSRSNVHSNFTSPQPLSQSFKFTHQNPHLPESDFVQTSPSNLKPDYISPIPTNSPNLNQIRNQSPLQFINKTTTDQRNHHQQPHQIDLSNHQASYINSNNNTNTNSSSTNLLQPCPISRSDETHQNENGFQNLNQDQTRRVWQNNEEIGVPYDYIESLLNSSFGHYAAPIDFDGIFLPS